MLKIDHFFNNRAPELFKKASSIIAQLANAGHEAMLAGGCVRDALLARNVQDFDIATSAAPDEIEAIFAGNTIPVGKSFGVIMVVYEGSPFQVATFRSDGNYSDGRRPDTVQFTDAKLDAERRDFTINGLFYDPLKKALIDYVGGVEDLEQGVIRAIGNPGARFREDHLRILRGIRFASVLNFTIESHTYDAMLEYASLLPAVSMERIGEEFSRILCESSKPSNAFNLLSDSDFFKQFMPELERLKGAHQPPEYHPEGDVWTHTCMMLDALQAPRDEMLAYAVLLHDIGSDENDSAKPMIRFPNHAHVGENIAVAILTRLKRPNDLIEAVATMVKRHMHFAEVLNMRVSTLRRFMGAPTFECEMELHRLDVLCSNKNMQAFNFLVEKKKEFDAETILPKA
jgi:poly(A) polymerase